MSSFVSRFGKKFDAVPGFFEAHGKNEIQATQLLAESSSQPKLRGPISYSGFLKDVFLYGMMVDFFAEYGIDLRVESSLDVGGSEGSVARLLSYEGRAKSTTITELYDMRALLDDALFARHMRTLAISLFRSKWKLGPSFQARIRELAMSHSYYPQPGDTIFNIKSKGPGKIDNYQIRNYYDISEKYDLVTAISVVDYFNPQKFFAKAGEIVNDGGYLYLNMANWWFARNCSLVVGDFPYAPQRLEKQDFERYLAEMRPDRAEDTMRRYNYFHLGEVHPTIGGYLEYADQAGFDLIGYKRTVPTKQKSIPFLPAEMNAFGDSQLADVLADIRRFDPSISIADLYTHQFVVALRKGRRTSTTLREGLSARAV